MKGDVKARVVGQQVQVSVEDALALTLSENIEE